MRKTAKVLAIGMTVLTLGLGLGATAVADTTSQGWTCGKTGGEGWTHTNVKCSTSGIEHVEARFDADGERLTLFDKYKNGHRTAAKLVADGYHPKWFTHDENLSIKEGKTVKFKVCTSKSAQAVCSQVYSTNA